MTKPTRLNQEQMFKYILSSVVQLNQQYPVITIAWDQWADSYTIKIDCALVGWYKYTIEGSLVDAGSLYHGLVCPWNHMVEEYRLGQIKPPTIHYFDR